MNKANPLASPYCSPIESTFTLFINANVYDGRSEALHENMSVLVKDNIIVEISDRPISIDGKPTIKTQTIDVKGRTLMPGIIAMHEHLMFQMSYSDLLSQDTRYAACVATEVARIYLMNGVTSVRDAAGNCFGLKRAIEAGHVTGPRIFPSGAMISQTGGHGDQRTNAHASCFCDFHNVHPLVKMGDMCVCDGADDVRKAARENLRMGATQIKLAVGGGVASHSDPLDVVQFSRDEIRAAVEAADDYNTYVMAHVYNKKGVQRAIECGVKSIEHGNMVDDEETMQLMKEKGVWLAPQVTVYKNQPPLGFTKEQIQKHHSAYEALDTMFKLAKKVGHENIVFGTDIIADLDKIRNLNEEFMYRTQWFSPSEILRQATSKGGELLSLSNRYNPGRLGVIEAGALADILVVDGNPLNDISIMTDPNDNIQFIMKDGQVYKNSMMQ
jgi:imidazolonepropionase-like amidohydrolase